MKFVTYINLSIIIYFQNTKTTILHIESRQTRTKNRQFEIFLECQGSKDSVSSISNVLHQNPLIQEMAVVGEKEASKKGKCVETATLSLLS